MHDLRFAFRSLSRAPAFTATAVLTLALGIGAATAVFSVANGVLLRPLPYDAPDEIVTVWASWDNFPDKTWLSVPEYQLVHQENRTLVDVALYGTSSTNFTSVDAPEQVGSAVVTPNTFEVLGVAPVAGRSFGWTEARDGSPGVVLGHDLWVRRYGADPAIVGQAVELNGEMTPVLGVLPEGFRLPVDFAASAAAEVYYPYYVDLESPAPDLDGGGSHGFHGVGRLREGVTVDAALTDLERVMAGVEPIGLYSPERRFTLRVFSAEADIVGSARLTLIVLLGAVGLVLLIACGNVANLLLARSEGRAGEMAVRTALGAGRWRIVRQILTESAVLAVLAGSLGFLFAWVGVDLLLAIDPDAVPRSSAVRMDAAVGLFTVAVSLLTVIVFGAAPALRVASSGVGGRLRRSGRGGLQGSPSSGVQRLLVASQMAMAVILLTGSGLLMRSFVGLLRIDPGFEAGDVLTLRTTTSAGRYPDAPSVARFYEDLLGRVREIPGVRSAGAARLLPLASTMGDAFFRPLGYEPAPNESTQGDWQWATPGYIETMGIPLLEGRTFDESDRRDAQPIVLINEALARRYWGDASPLGRAVLTTGAADTAVVVGVVGNLRHNGITGEVKGRYYVPHAQVNESMTGSMRGMTLTVGTVGDPRRLVEAVRAEVAALDPTMPVSQVQSLDEVLSTSLAQPRFGVVLLGAFAALALGLAVVGIYGVIAYSVSLRTGEIGIRLALGARAGQVVGMVVRQGFAAALAGVGAGTVAAWYLADMVSGLLYGVEAQDPVTFAGVPALLLAVALVACWLPAVRATHVRPAAALRHE